MLFLPFLLVFSCIESEEKQSTDTDPVDQDGDGVFSDLDCNDHDPSVFPGAEEFCDDIDHDCDGDLHSEATDTHTWYADTDGDGYGNEDSTTEACEKPSGYVALPGDCDDTSAVFHPGASEWDCTDPSDYNCDGSVQYEDADNDSYPACDDCDDTQPSANPAAVEVCDGIDNDCSGDIDEDAVDATIWYADSDGDGFGGTIFEAIACEPPAGFVADNTDCNDLDSATYPSAAETCDEADNDCDGTIDEGVQFTWYADSDSDGYGSVSSTEEGCTPSPGFTTNANDCDDSNPTTNPSAYEICDAIDNNCDGAVDESTALDAQSWYPDTDGDGWGDESSTPTDSCQALSGFVDNHSDCDDTRGDRHPQAQEICSGSDEDCDGLVDELDPSLDVSTQADFYLDTDGDGYGGPNTITACLAPSGTATDSTDCNDNDASIHPAASELPGDGVDNNCVNDLPVVETISLSPAALYTDDTLLATVTSSDSDGDAVVLSYAWSVENTVVLQGVGETTLSGSVYFSKGQSVFVTVTPDDGVETGSALQSSTLPVLNTTPGPPVLAISPTTPRTGLDNVICLVDTECNDSDGDTCTYSFSWQLGGTPWNGSTTSTHHAGDTLSASDTVENQVWTCIAEPHDGETTGTTATVDITIAVADSDGDGVYDDEDLCPGFDDATDANNNSLPDDCETYTTFDYTGSPQTFTVPTDVSLIHIDCQGAQGWSGGNSGGEGGQAEGLLTVTPGDQLYVYVGGQGTLASGDSNPTGGGWNGGGDGQNNGGSQTVGGGGGASDVRSSSSTDPLDNTALSSRLIVGAGGGGATNNTGAWGGDGGGLTGENGGIHNNNHQATGGSQTSGGSANAGFGYGGSGDGSMTPWNGGGGSGWYGGGTSTAHSGGAGGSSYVGGMDTGSVTTGGNSGHGRVTITWSQP